MTTKTATKYNIGGVALDRPFKIRRLGHFGFNASDFEASRRFYSTCSAFLSPSPPAPVFSDGMPAIIILLLCSTRKNSTNASTLATTLNIFATENDINQITWQVQSVAEMAEATKYFHDLGVEVMRQGRAGAVGIAVSSLRLGAG